MVFEQFLEHDWVEKRVFYVFVLGFVYVFIGHFAAILFFKDAVSVSMLFLATLLLVPSLNKLLKIEEKRESSEGTRHFFKNHKDIFEVYLSLSIGIFLGYMCLGLFVGSGSSVFDYQAHFLENEGLSRGMVTEFFSEEFTASFKDFTAIISNNLSVILIFFFLSVFYGAGAMFLLVLNASIFSTFILFVINNIGNGMLNSLAILGIFLIHMIPEVSGFLAAAIAGGVVSRAFGSEKFMSRGFKNVLKDASVLLAIAIAFIIIAAFLETFVTARVVHSIV